MEDEDGTWPKVANFDPFYREKLFAQVQKSLSFMRSCVRLEAEDLVTVVEKSPEPQAGRL